MDWHRLSYEEMKGRHAKLVAEILEAQECEQSAARTEAVARKRFLARYRIRAFLYRFAPQWAPLV